MRLFPHQTPVSSILRSLFHDCTRRKTERRRQIQLRNRVILTRFPPDKTVSSTVCGEGLFEGCNNGALSLFIFGAQVFFFCFFLPLPWSSVCSQSNWFFMKAVGLWMVKSARQPQRSVFCLSYDSQRRKQLKEHL